jgi:hypothetical protein
MLFVVVSSSSSSLFSLDGSILDLSKRFLYVLVGNLLFLIRQSLSLSKAGYMFHSPLPGL